MNFNYPFQGRAPDRKIRVMGKIMNISNDNALNEKEAIVPGKTQYQNTLVLR